MRMMQTVSNRLTDIISQFDASLTAVQPLCLTSWWNQKNELDLCEIFLWSHFEMFEGMLFICTHNNMQT